jgi:hypothetical protein
MKKLIIAGLASFGSFFLALCIMTYQDSVKHPSKYRPVELYYVEAKDADGYFHARNEHGTVVFLPENVQGAPVTVGITVAISLDLAGENPLVEVYDDEEGIQ